MINNIPVYGVSGSHHYNDKQYGSKSDVLAEPIYVHMHADTFEIKDDDSNRNMKIWERNKEYE